LKAKLYYFKSTNKSESVLQTYKCSNSLLNIRY